MNARLPLAVLTLALLTTPARAAQEVPVDLRPDAGPQLKAERTMKSLLDEWAATAFDIRFQARPEVDLAAPRQVKIHLDGFTIAFNADWYRRYKAFHDDLVKQPFGSETLDHALAYCRQGDGRLVATVVDGAGKALWTAPVGHSRAPSHYAPVEAHLFAPPVRRDLPLQPPDLRQLWPPPPGEVPFVIAPIGVASAAKRIRITDLDGRRWPVSLGDPVVQPPPARPPAALPAGGPIGTPSPSANGAPRLSPPILSSPAPRAAPTARVAPPRRDLR